MWEGFYFYVSYITFVSLNYPEDCSSSVLNHRVTGLGNKGNGFFKGDIEQGLANFSCKEQEIK